MSELEQFIIEDYKAISSYEDEVVDVLFKELISENLLTNAQYRNILIESSKIEDEIILEKSGRRARPVHFENATSNSITVMPDNVTISPEQFKKVWTDYDTYPDESRVAVALGFRPDSVFLDRAPDTIRNLLGYRGGSYGLVHWYNDNNPNDSLVPNIKDRKDYYSKAAKNLYGGEVDGVPYQPEANDQHINPGRGRAARNSKKVQQLNSTEIVAGEFYNNLTRIKPRRWTHWAKVWDRRLSSVQPNKRSLFGSMIGKVWKKTFLLGYQMTDKSFYELWYNSLDSSFSVYDQNGVEFGSPVPTLRESIQQLIHVIAQASKTDQEIIRGGKNAHNINQIAQSLDRVMKPELDRSIGAVRREEELMAKEVKKDREDRKERMAASKAKRNRRVDVGRKRQAERVGLTDKQFIARRNAEKAIKMYNSMVDDLTEKLKKVKKSGDSDALSWQSSIEYNIQQIEQKITQAQQLIDNINSQKVEVDDSGEIVVDNRSVSPSMMDAITTRTIEKMKQQYRDVLSGASASVANVMSDLHTQQTELDNIRRGKEAERRRQEEIEQRRRDNERVFKKQQQNRRLSPEVVKMQQQVMALDTAAAIAKFNANPAHSENTWQDIDPALRKRKTNSVANLQAMPAHRARKAWNDEFDHLSAKRDKIRQEIKKEIAMSNADQSKEEENIRRQALNPNAQKRQMNEGFLDDLVSDVDEESGETEYNYTTPEVQRHVDFIRKGAEQSSYNTNVLISSVLGEVSQYTKTKVKSRSGIKGIVTNITNKLSRGRSHGIESPMAGSLDRVKMFIKGEQYRADFITGFSIGDRINLEIWYVMEPDRNGKVISSFLVYDVNSQLVLRSYLPYYRNALTVVSAKISSGPEAVR